MTWDLREQVLIARWQAQGHELRAMSITGIAACLRCGRVIHVRSRAQHMAEWEDSHQGDIGPCSPSKKARVTHLTRP